VTTGKHAISYRPDIDGLRAIAVGAVVLFHANLVAIGQGFLGVDIFFVISGYLITGILLEDSSILRFYQRRARRILPALFAVLVVVLGLGLLLLLPGDLKALARSAQATLAFSSNILFWRKSNYFAHETELWPLLHTWSLGLEEQFYIVFPLLVRLVRRWERRKLAILFGLLALVSFAIAVIAVQRRFDVPAFYLLPARAWELLVGSIVATGVLPPIHNRTARAAAGLIALAMVVLPLTQLMPPLPFPGWGALLPVLGAAGLIWVGAGGPHPVGTLLGLRPVIFIGLISYSLYLWHWPALAFARYVAVRPLTHVEAALVVLASVVLAWASWRFVERPFRRRSVSDRTVWLFSAAGIALLVSAAALMLAARGLPQRFPPAIAKLNASSDATWRCPFSSFIRFGPATACRLSLPSGKAEDADIVLWGDSHAQMYVPALLGALGDRRGLLVYAYGCAPVLGDAADALCGATQRANYAAIVKLPARVVILAENWPQYRDEAGGRLGRDPLPSERYHDAIRRLRDLVAGLRQAGKLVVLVPPLALPGYDVGGTVSRELLFHGKTSQKLGVTRAEYEAEYANVLAAYADMARDPRVRIVPVEQGACDAHRCGYIWKGRAVFADQGHLATEFATTLTPIFARTLAGMRN